MELLIKCLLISWFWPATGMSLFWGIRGTVLFANRKKYPENTIWWQMYQFIFNFIGSFAGWSCFYVLLIRIQNNMPKFQGFTGGDIVLFIASLLGLTGHLPQTLYGFVESFAEITKKAVEKLYKTS